MGKKRKRILGVLLSVVLILGCIGLGTISVFAEESQSRIYVGGVDANDGNDGLSESSPLATLETALSKCTDSNVDYEIILQDDITLTQALIIQQAGAKSITIDGGSEKHSIISDSYSFNIYVNATLKNLIIDSKNSIGLTVGNGTTNPKVMLENCEVKHNPTTGHSAIGGMAQAVRLQSMENFVPDVTLKNCIVTSSGLTDGNTTQLIGITCTNNKGGGSLTLDNTTVTGQGSKAQVMMVAAPAAQCHNSKRKLA